MIRNNLLLPAMLMAMLFYSCNKDNTEQEIPAINQVNVSNITETSCQVNWKVNDNTIDKIIIEVSKDADFGILQHNLEKEDVTSSTLLLDSLQGATDYYLRIKAQTNGNLVFTTENLHFETGYKSESLFITTVDDHELATKIKYLESNPEPKACLIFMHEMGAFVNNWKGADIVVDLVAQNYVCVTFDFRGHGSSTPIPDLMQLLNDRSLIVKDLQAIMNNMKNHSHVDPDKFGLVGGSLGGIMAVAGNGYEEVKTSVSLSGTPDGIYEIFPDLVPQSVLYVAGENDIHPGENINFAELAEDMYNISLDPKKLIIVPNASEHGSELLIRSVVEEEVFNWIISHL